MTLPKSGSEREEDRGKKTSVTSRRVVDEAETTRSANAVMLVLLQ